MTTTYRLIVIGSTGMYTYGNRAATPDLARLAVGNLCRGKGLLGIEAQESLGDTWTDSAGMSHARYSDPVLVEAESTPNEWHIGASA